MSGGNSSTWHATVTGTSATIYCFELSILACGAICLTTFVVILQRTRCFHQTHDLKFPRFCQNFFDKVRNLQNLRLLLIHLGLSFLLIVLSRYLITIPLLIAFFGEVDVAGVGFCRVVWTMRDTGMYISGLDLFALVIERTCATLRVRTYERMRTPALAVVLIFMQWMIAALFVAMNQLGTESADESREREYYAHLLPCQRAYLSKTAVGVSMATTFLADCIAILVFVSLLHINKRRYVMSSAKWNEHSLSERYQVSENIRSTRLLWPMMVSYFLGSLVGILFATIALKQLMRAFELVQDIQSLFEQLTTARTWGQAFDLVLALLTVVLPNLALRGHESLLRETRRLASVCTSDPTKVTSDTAQQPSTLNGQRLILSTSEERDIYFAELNNMWNR